MNRRPSLALRRIGLGCMPLTGIYGAVSRDVAIEIIQCALELGISSFDTAELYGPYLNEELLADALGSDLTRVEISTKVGYRFQDGKFAGLDSRPQSMRLAVEGSLRRLRREYVDVLYQHRPDPSVPVEDVVGAMADLVSEGKALALGLSATDPDSLRRASAIHPIAFIQNEYSLIARDPEKALLPSILETSTQFVCYSPLGRGLLAGKPLKATQQSMTDYRNKDARFQPLRHAELVNRLAPLWQIAAVRSVSPAAIALAWLLSKSPAIRVIPSATDVKQLQANTLSGDTVLTVEEIDALDLVAAT
jgi:aryl-alcohol dehydrogenase-like predicted oxidoreductase